MHGEIPQQSDMSTWQKYQSHLCLGFQWDGSRPAWIFLEGKLVCLSWRVHRTPLMPCKHFLTHCNEDIFLNNSSSWEDSHQHEKPYIALQLYVCCGLKGTVLRSGLYIHCKENGWCEDVHMIIMTYPAMDMKEWWWTMVWLVVWSMHDDEKIVGYDEVCTMCKESTQKYYWWHNIKDYIMIKIKWYDRLQKYGSLPR
jgi:hypothetical protein